MRNGRLEARLRETAAHATARIAGLRPRIDDILARIGAIATSGPMARVTRSHRIAADRLAGNVERRRRARLPLGAMLAIKCAIGAGGLWMAVQAASLVGELAAAPRPDLAIAAPPVEATSSRARRIETTLWQPVVRPAAYLHVASANLEGLALTHEARRNLSGVREDLIGYGAFETDRPHLQLVARLGPPEEPRSFVIETVRRAAQLGLSADRVSQPDPVATKFGPFEASDVTLSAMGEQRACLAFRSAVAELPVSLQGWWCGTTQRPADRQQLVCLIDRLVLTQAGEAGELRGHFTAAELKRDERCNPSRLASAGRKPTWLDADAAALPLRSVPKPPEPAPRARPKKPPQTRG